MVNCPICGETVSLQLINTHLDHCEKSVKNEPEIISIDDEPLLKKQKNSINSILQSQPKTKPLTPIKTASNIKPVVNDKVNIPIQIKDNWKDPQEELRQLKALSQIPLSERLRPKTLDDYIGQSHLLSRETGILRGFIQNDTIPSMIFWGPPGVGKTTISRIIANSTSYKFIELNATSNGIQDLRKNFELASKEFFLTKRKTIIFCDEIHRYNKSQQDFFLPFVEKGQVILIGATTENPSFQLNNALLSRCKVFILEKLSIKDISIILNKGLLNVNKIRKLIFGKPLLSLNKQGIDYLAGLSNGDSRIAINLLELIDSYYMNQASNHDNVLTISIDELKPILKQNSLLYDKMGDNHYDTISAFHKSIRGSNANAALWYLAKMIKSGEDPLYIARRLIRIASEDIGLKDESCLPFAVATYQAIQMVGLPEADLSLVQCTVKLSNASKSIKLYKSWKQMMQIMENENLNNFEIPIHLRNAPTKLMKEIGYGAEYKYNPNYLNGEVKQDYLPLELKKYGDILKSNDHLGELIDEDL